MRSNLTSRLGIALSSASTGPVIDSPQEAEVVRRLVTQWIEVHEDVAPARQRLLIAMRYGCNRCAARLCRRVLSDPGAPAATQVTALLTALALDLDDTQWQAHRRLTDDRTALVWQLIASRNKKIRTQVRDVALVVLLHRRGIDPRSVGFDELQADPVLVFRDHSLGFPDDPSRRDSHQRAMQLLPSIGSP